MDAWNAAYEQLADVFIQFESDLYEKAANTPGGWEGWRKFTVSQKIHESDEIISFYLTPSDKGALPSFFSGQFVSVRVFVPELGVYQPRQYSLSDIPDGKHLRISVKKEFATETKPPGRISNILHEHLPEGSELDVSMPFGDFTLDVNTNTPVVLISGGVGITPMISMLMNVVEHGKNRRVVFVHAVRNGHVHAMKDILSQTMSENPQVSRAIFYEEVTENEKQGLDYDYQGRIELGKIKKEVLLPDANYYLCGPVPFMSAQQKGLEGFGIPSERIHSEVFGSGLMV
jgi:nitric oxide dioxygenase